MALANIAQAAVRLGFGSENLSTAVSNFMKTITRFDPEPWTCIAASSATLIYWYIRDGREHFFEGLFMTGIKAIWDRVGEAKIKQAREQGRKEGRQEGREEAYKEMGIDPPPETGKDTKPDGRAASCPPPPGQPPVNSSTTSRRRPRSAAVSFPKIQPPPSAGIHRR